MKKLSKSEMKKLAGGLDPISGCAGPCHYYRGSTLVRSTCGTKLGTAGSSCLCIGSTLPCALIAEP